MKRTPCLFTDTVLFLLEFFSHHGSPQSYHFGLYKDSVWLAKWTGGKEKSALKEAEDRIQILKTVLESIHPKVGRSSQGGGILLEQIVETVWRSCPTGGVTRT